jgi:hypothetical protein
MYVTLVKVYRLNDENEALFGCQSDVLYLEGCILFIYIVP